jgi:hypothetical protein
VVDRQPCLLEILDTGKLNSSRKSGGQKLTMSRCGPVPESERYVCKGIGGFRACLLVNQLRRHHHLEYES